jgi:hypothetical protein
LEAALDSVFRQIDAEPFEVVLISAILDPPSVKPFERRAEAVGLDFRIVHVTPGPVGAALLTGVKSAHGDVIAILDDDDVWEPCKMKAVQQAFTADSNLAFFHNGQTFVDEENRSIPPWSFHRLIRHSSSRIPEGLTVRMSAGDTKAARMLLMLEPMFNNSSMSLRKSLLEVNQGLMSQVTGGEDSFLFYSALASGATVEATSDRLTRVRMHGLASTAAQDQSAAYASRVSAYSSYMVRHLNRLGLCEDLLAGTRGNEAFRMLRRDVAQWKLLERVVRGHESTTSVSRETRILLGSDGFPAGLRDILTILLGFGSLVSEDMVRAAFMASRMNW